MLERNIGSEVCGVNSSSQDVHVETVCAVLFRHDPVGIAHEGGQDEYHPEAEDIAARLPLMKSLDETTRMVHGVFVHWFSEGVAGGMERYWEVAAEVWQAREQGRRRG